MSSKSSRALVCSVVGVQIKVRTPAVLFARATHNFGWAKLERDGRADRFALAGLMSVRRDRRKGRGLWGLRQDRQRGHWCAWRNRRSRRNWWRRRSRQVQVGAVHGALLSKSRACACCNREQCESRHQNGFHQRFLWVGDRASLSDNYGENVEAFTGPSGSPGHTPTRSPPAQATQLQFSGAGS